MKIVVPLQVDRHLPRSLSRPYFLSSQHLRLDPALFLSSLAPSHPRLSLPCPLISRTFNISEISIIHIILQYSTLYKPTCQPTNQPTNQPNQYKVLLSRHLLDLRSDAIVVGDPSTFTVISALQLSGLSILTLISPAISTLQFMLELQRSLLGDPVRSHLQFEAKQAASTKQVTNYPRRDSNSQPPDALMVEV